MNIKNYKHLLLPLIIAGFISACSTPDTLSPKQFIIFRANDVKKVEGRLYYKEMKVSRKAKNEVILQGRLIFMNLKGWHSKEPVPSYTYRTSDKQLIKNLDVYQQVPVYSYWAIDETSICYIPVRLIIGKVNAKTFDLKLLSLEYHNENLKDGVILSSDAIIHKNYFKIRYNSEPLIINSLKLLESKDFNINHSIEIQIDFPPSWPKDDANPLIWT